MIIQDMTHTETEDMIAHAGIGYLACSVDNKPYVVPLRFVYSAGYFYSLTSEGKKMELMRANPQVCLSFSDVRASNHWRSLVITGRFEEIVKSLENNSAYIHAHDLLASKPEWWEPAYVRTVIKGEERVLEPVYFRISVQEITGHKTIA
jgi:nitroimidazol reductase NimA-like FMN-containing flavoprotein (pyridoxamine 5'-phosphate oxidase superfamily)